MTPLDKRVAEIAVEHAKGYAGKDFVGKDIEQAIRAALADPVIVATIRAQAFEEAAKVCVWDAKTCPKHGGSVMDCPVNDKEVLCSSIYG